jgi:hypothetical protein
MKMVRVAVMAILVLGVAAVVAGQDSSQRLVVAERDSSYELTVPVSRLTLTIPKGKLVAQKSSGGSDSPRYFMFENRENALIVSGWFEPEQSFKSMDAFWSGEQRSLTQNGLQLQNITKERIGNWDVVLYDIAVPGGRSVNMRAECVQSGTWIDLHLSVTTNQSKTDGQKLLRDALNAMQVSEKKQ